MSQDRAPAAKVVGNRRKTLTSVAIVGTYLALWLLTHLVGSPQVLERIRNEEAQRSGNDVPDQHVRAWSPAPFLLLDHKLIHLRSTDLTSGQATVRTFKITSLHMWIVTPHTLKQEVWSSEVKSSPGSAQ